MPRDAPLAQGARAAPRASTSSSQNHPSAPMKRRVCGKVFKMSVNGIFCRFKGHGGPILSHWGAEEEDRLEQESDPRTHNL